MNKIWLIVILTLGITAASFTACYAQKSDDNKNASILLRELPQDLTARTAAQQIEFVNWLSGGSAAKTESRSASLPDLGVRQVVLDLDFKKPATMKTLSEKMREVGPAALTELDELLTSQDDATREKAVFALRCLVNRDENAPKETTQADKLIALLLRRAVLDRNFKTRQSAITGLSALGFAGYTDVMSDVLAGLTDAQDDPDQRNSSRAKDNLKIITNSMQQQ